MDSSNGLKHGQFKVLYSNDSKFVEQTVNHLTQEEIADGWQLAMPRLQRYSELHHFSIYLSQLQPHLWPKLVETHYNGETRYELINDSFYQYTIKPSKNDDKIKKLFELISKSSPDIKLIKPLYKNLEEQRIKGWIMLKAKQLLNSF